MGQITQVNEDSKDKREEIEGMVSPDQAQAKNPLSSNAPTESRENNEATLQEANVTEVEKPLFSKRLIQKHFAEHM